MNQTVETTPLADSLSDRTRKPWIFRERWRIQGCLIAETPLFIGSGETTARDELKNDGKPVDIADCLRDVRGLPVIPGTSLKGVLQAWLGGKERCKDKKRILRLFGEDSDKDAGSGRGGEAEFLDARMTLLRSAETPLPHWNQNKQTWVEIINSIDRERGAAAENHLAHRETVAAGSGFDVMITGQFTEPAEDLALLMAALDGFNNERNPVTLGADTGSGKGRMRWELTTVEKLDTNRVLAWLKKPDRGMAYTAFQRVTPEELAALRTNATAISIPGPASRNFSITLNFNGPFLVNNPPTEAEKKSTNDQGSKPPDARPRTNEMGEVILPAKSFRGVLRSQGEKILRTMLELDEKHWNLEAINRYAERHIACRPEIPARACKPLKDNEDQGEQLCLACQVFGAPGWRSPLSITDFTLKEGNYERQTQEFVAIDRFTGGGKDSAKYNAFAIISPVLKGELKVDNKRLPDWGPGLLALVLRDLKEGELNFGWGAAGKGYGRCKTAEIDGWDEEDFRKETIAAWQKLKEAVESHKHHLDNQM